MSDTENSGKERGTFDEILAECPDCEFGNLKAESHHGEKILRCSFVECGRVVKTFQDEWPDHVSRSLHTGSSQTASYNEPEGGSE